MRWASAKRCPIEGLPGSVDWPPGPAAPEGAAQEVLADGGAVHEPARVLARVLPDLTLVFPIASPWGVPATGLVS